MDKENENTSEIKNEDKTVNEESNSKEKKKAMELNTKTQRHL